MGVAMFYMLFVAAFFFTAGILEKIIDCFFWRWL